MNVNQLLASFIIFLFFHALQGQTDAHYWTHQYGAKGLLLNGAVIASTEDETAIFYNPGAMGRGEKFGLSLSFLTPTYSELSTENFLGRGTVVTDDDFGFSPGFAAVGFPLFGDERFRGGATTFTRFRSNLNFRDRELGFVADNDQQLFIGNLDFHRGLSERWFGFGTSFQIDDHLSVGAAQFVVFHSESTDIQIKKDIVSSSQPENLLFSWRSSRRYSFNASGGFLTKIGLSWKPQDDNDILIGLTITTPDYGFLHKSASLEIDELSKTSPDSTFIKSNLTGATLQDFKTPFSIGYGIEFNYRDWRWSLAAEYFREIPTYTVIKSVDDPFDGLLEGTTIETTIREGNKEIFNFAIGAQKQLYDGSTLIFGFRTDFNQRVPIEGFSEFAFLASTPSIFHFSAGGLFQIWGNQASIGFDFGYGNRRGSQNLVDFSDINPETLSNLTSSRTVNSSFRSFVLIMTYDFIFKRRN